MEDKHKQLKDLVMGLRNTIPDIFVEFLGDNSFHMSCLNNVREEELKIFSDSVKDIERIGFQADIKNNFWHTTITVFGVKRYKINNIDKYK